MTRQTGTTTPLPYPARGDDELTRAAATAAALIELAINESLAPVETLGRALARIAEMTSGTEESRTRELAVCIESLQFHDRLVQQLTQVRDLLAGVTSEPRTATDDADWPALCERLRVHFTSESHRLLFDLLMPGKGEAELVHLHAEEGSVELF